MMQKLTSKRKIFILFCSEPLAFSHECNFYQSHWSTYLKKNSKSTFSKTINRQVKGKGEPPLVPSAALLHQILWVRKKKKKILSICFLSCHLWIKNLFLNVKWGKRERNINASAWQPTASSYFWTAWTLPPCSSPQPNAWTSKWDMIVYIWKEKYLTMYLQRMAIIYRYMCETFKEVHKTFRNRVRKAGVYVRHLHLSIPVHIWPLYSLRFT